VRIAGAGFGYIGKRNLPITLQAPLNSEVIRDAKGWLGEQMGNPRYHEVSDQPALAAIVNIETAKENSRSFRKLCAVMDEFLAL
jgi:hypothetical protein